MYVMRRLFVAAMAAATFMASGDASLAQAVPAEIPSASYRGDQYVDSRGCAFVRVGVGGNTQWVPRVGRDRRQLCGLSPTGGGDAGRVATTAPRNPAGVTVIGGAASAAVPSAPRATPTLRSTATNAATAAPRPVIIAPPAPAAPARRSIGTQPRPPAVQPRSVATQPRIVPPVAPVTVCPNLPADIRGYFRGPDPRCGPQAVHPGDAVRGRDRTSALGADIQPAIRQVVRYAVNPPAGYRPAWDDGRLNPYRGITVADGQRQMEQVWTNALPRRLVGSPEHAITGLLTGNTRDAGPARLVRGQVVILRP